MFIYVTNNKHVYSYYLIIYALLSTHIELESYILQY